jgi:hypothetical protein
MYHNGEDRFRAGGFNSLTALPTDQFFLAQVLAHREGGYLHSSAAILDGQGLLFVGHSEAGKSTTVKMLQGKAEILCDDRNIVRRWPEGFRVHGTWSHGEVPLVSPASAPLKAILFLQQSKKNRLVRLTKGGEIRRLSACLPLSHHGRMVAKDADLDGGHSPRFPYRLLGKAVQFPSGT